MPTDSPTVPRRSFAWWWIPVAVLVAILVAFLFPWKLNFLRGTIAEKVQQGTGRSFAIDGDIWLYWLQGPRVTIDGLKLGNPDWASTPQMVSVDHVDSTISLGNLLRKRFVLPKLSVDKPVVHLEESPDGKRNWYFDKQQSDSSTSVVIRELAMNDGHVAYVAKAKDTDVQVDLATITGAQVDTKGGGTTGGVGAKAKGKWNGLPLTVDASAGDVLKLQQADVPYPFDVKASIGATRVTAKGTVTGLAALKAADLRVSVAGKNLDEWYRIVGVGLPSTPPYDSAGHVVIADGKYRYDDFTGHMGSSDMAGSVAFEKREARPFVSGTLVSKQLDLADFQPMIGKTPSPDSAPVKGERAAPVRKDRLLPQQNFSTEKWNTLDADVKLIAKSIKNAGSIPFDNLEMHAKMNDRVLSFEPLKFGFADGTMGGNLRFDGGAKPIAAKVDAKFADLQLGRLQPKLTESSKHALGRLNGAIALDGRGDSIAAMMGGANGSVQIAMGRGELSSLLLELAGLQGPQIVRYLLGDQNAKINCALIDTTITKGDLWTKESLIDTELNVVQIAGNANFADETLDIDVRPLPKHKSIVVLRTPFHVAGTFADPKINPDYGTLALRGGGAIGLGLLNPLLALLPLIETGPGEDSACADLLANGALLGAAVTMGSRVLLYHIGAVAAAQCLTAFFAVWITHHDTEDDGLGARTQRSRLINLVSYNMFFHLEHHLFPAVPVKRLGRLAERIDGTVPEIATRAGRVL